jgi:hypothetical protein
MPSPSRLFQSSPYVHDLYFSFAHNLGAAHSFAQCARWKTNGQLAQFLLERTLFDTILLLVVVVLACFRYALHALIEVMLRWLAL